jgi:hypothetical protein
MTPLEVLAITRRIKFRDWGFGVGNMGDGSMLRVAFVVNGELQIGRKWYVSPHAIPEEVVQTALKAVLTALEHEAREEFTYEGRAIYGPHFSLTALIEAADAHREARRAEAPQSA